MEDCYRTVFRGVIFITDFEKSLNTWIAIETYENGFEPGIKEIVSESKAVNRVASQMNRLFQIVENLNHHQVIRAEEWEQFL